MAERLVDVLVGNNVVLHTYPVSIEGQTVFLMIRSFLLEPWKLPLTRSWSPMPNSRAYPPKWHCHVNLRPRREGAGHCTGSG